jgi:hypothetical protein
MRGLNLDYLRAFVDVIERGSFSAAARGLGLTQPAVSLVRRDKPLTRGLRETVRALKALDRTAARTAARPRGDAGSA